MPTQDYKTLDGKPVPGVTTVIGDGLGWGKEPLMIWAERLGREGKSFAEERDKAARIGTLTHARIEQYLGGEKVDLEGAAPDEVAESDAPFKAFREWKESVELKVIHRELPIVSEAMRVGGTLDLYCRLGGDNAIIDFKTSRTIQPGHIVQVAAYRALMKEHLSLREPIARVALLHLPRGCKKAKLLTVTNQALDEGETTFRALCRIYQAHKSLMPKLAFSNGSGA